MKVKKIIKSIIICFLLNLILFSNCSFAINDENLEIFSEAVILIHKDTGKVLYSKNAEHKMYPASTTKILTAIIAIESLSLDEKLTASYEAVMSIPSGYSNAAIQVGEDLTVKELLEVFLVHSANEAGYILAENISGSFSKFANLMNEKAEQIGCKNTHFTNPSGLHDENHYTTAHDLALIAQYCMQNETFRNFVSMTSCTISPTDKYEERYFKNTNEMLNSKSRYYNENVIGIKTGYTSQAQNCLISGFEKDGLEFISVVLGAPASVDGKSLSGKYTDTQTLFDYGIENFNYKDISITGQVVTQVEVEHATTENRYLDLVLEDNINAFVNNSLDVKSLNPEIKINDDIHAPISANDVLGTVTYNIDGTTYTSNLIAKNDVTTSMYFETFIKLIFAIVILIIIFELMYSRKKKKRKKKNGKKSNEKYLYGRVKY